MSLWEMVHQNRGKQGVFVPPKMVVQVSQILHYAAYPSVFLNRSLKFLACSRTFGLVRRRRRQFLVKGEPDDKIKCADFCTPSEWCHFQEDPLNVTPSSCIKKYQHFNKKKCVLQRHDVRGVGAEISQNFHNVIRTYPAG